MQLLQEQQDPDQEPKSTATATDEAVEQYWALCDAEEYVEAAEYAAGHDVLGEEYVFQAAQDAYDEAMENGFYDEAADIADQFEIGTGKKTWAGLRKKLESGYVALLGNRATAAGAALMLSSGNAVFSTSSTGVPVPHHSHANLWENLSFFVGTALFGVTGGGTHSLPDYREAKEKLRSGEFNQESLEEKFANHRHLLDYCLEQGIYLAVRDDEEALEAFKAAKENASPNFLPNF